VTSVSGRFGADGAAPMTSATVWRALWRASDGSSTASSDVASLARGTHIIFAAQEITNFVVESQ